MKWPVNPPDRYRLLQLYYLSGTPLFVLLDLMFGANIRVAALEPYPVLKYGYYLVCLGCGVLTRAVPHLSAAVALIESSLNVLLLILGAFVPYFRLIEQVVANGTVETAAMTPALVMNFAISAAIWIISFYRNPLLSGPQHRHGGPR